MIRFFVEGFLFSFLEVSVFGVVLISVVLTVDTVDVGVIVLATVVLTVDGVGVFLLSFLFSYSCSSSSYFC